ncbi:hypothetical protein C0J52_05335 [Blattella germanica]|nr:hypothetical protein C0J52_05335 [Blattella germanica]
MRECLDEYKKNGIQFWGISPQNEPFHGVTEYYHFNSMGWTPDEQRDWIANYFGEALHTRGYKNLKLMILDDNRTFLPGWAESVLADPKVRNYVHGIAIHWYFDELDPNGSRLTQTHYEFPDKFLLYTEASDLNHWVTGWLDWNLALDTEGGPNWAGNRVDSPVVINATGNVFYKQPLFYALAHFAKFVPPGSRRIAYKISSTLVECVAFLRPDNIVAIVIQNRRNEDLDMVVLLPDRRNIVIPARRNSMHTILYKPTVRNQQYGNQPPVWEGRGLIKCEETNQTLNIKSPCAYRKYNYDSVVCVCNATYCDDIGTIPEPTKDKYLHIVSSLDGDRLACSEEEFTTFGPFFIALVSPVIVLYEIQTNTKFQTMKGFGGAMTDAAGMNIASLSNATQEKLLRQYFGEEGINYSFIRVPIGGTDFSTHYYTLDDSVNDTKLEHFSLSEEDFLYKNFNIYFSAPEWMKKPRIATTGWSMLQEKYYQLYVEYHIKFLDAYKKHGLNFWGISPQNEPFDGYLYFMGFNSMGWSPEEQGNWIGKYFGPTLRDKGYGDIKIIAMDEQRIFLPSFMIIDINNWTTAWVDWNIALDLSGGPNWINNTVDSPIIANATADEFYKQPTFYALAHFSKFVPPGSRRIVMDSPNSKGLQSVAFITLENKVVIVILNKLDKDMYVSITTGLQGNIQLWLKAHSIHTFIYKN